MNTTRTGTFLVLIASIWLFIPQAAHSGIGTVLPISVGLGTSIAQDSFPVTVKLGQGNLFLTDPQVLFLDDNRIGVKVRFQAYDHRPDLGIAISEMGHAQFSGALDYDRATRQILLHEPGMDMLEFDRESAVTQRLSKELKLAWSERVSNPIRSDIPQHPYVVPFKDNIQDISYNGSNIELTILYE